MLAYVDLVNGRLTFRWNMNYRELEIPISAYRVLKWRLILSSLSCVCMAARL